MYKQELLRVSPESIGITSERVMRLVGDLEKSTEMHGFMLARNGKVAAETWWKPYHADMPHILHSLGKSYVATGIGLACSEGLLSVDDKIVDLFSAEIREFGICPSAYMKMIQVKHLLTMSNGMAAQPTLNENLLQNYLSEPVVFEPGSQFMYNTAGTSMLCAIIQKVTGIGIRDYMEDRLFSKIGIETDKLRWLKYKNGLDASPGIATTAENNLRLGMLYLQMGCWEGKRYISESWMQEATTVRIDSSFPGAGSGSESSYGYGYQLWFCSVPGVYRFDGGHGQYVVVSPRHQVVIAVNQSGIMPYSTSRVLNVICAFLNELDTQPNEPLEERNAESASLSCYLGSRELAKGTTTALPENPTMFDGIYEITEGNFHIYLETRPNDRDNFDKVFYSIENENARTISISYKDPAHLEILFNNFTKLDVRLDGEMTPVYSKGAISTYDLTCSTGYFDGNDTLVVHTRWIQTAAKTTITFRHYPNELVIDVVKTTLHESSPEIHCTARAKRYISPA